MEQGIIYNLYSIACTECNQVKECVNNNNNNYVFQLRQRVLFLYLPFHEMVAEDKNAKLLLNFVKIK